MTPTERQAWIVRWLLLWTVGSHSPRVCVKDRDGLAWAYRLRDCSPTTLAPDLAHLRAAGLLTAKRLGRRTVYWLTDPKAAHAWEVTQPPTLPEVIPESVQ